MRAPSIDVSKNGEYWAMIRVAADLLDPKWIPRLRKLQANVDKAPNFPEKVKAAKTAWENRSSKTKLWQAVGTALAAMCPGMTRCMYCEDSKASSIDHYRPMAHYPDYVFIRKNYIYACSVCNSSSKGDRWAVLTPTGLSDVPSRKSGDAPMPPPQGSPVLLNPRIEDPFDYLELDFVHTFHFTPATKLDECQKERANYTIRTLRLNEGVLPDARRDALESFRAILDIYVRGDGAEKKRQKRNILAQHHPAVWRKMCAHHSRLPEVADLFRQAPEALNW